MAKYIALRKIHGKRAVEVGEVIELTESQAKHPLYQGRVRRHDGDVNLDPATPSKAAIIEQLKAQFIEFDGRKSAEDLAALLPENQ